MVTTSAGTKFWICAALPATYDANGFSALSYTQIRGVRQIGDIVQQYTTVLRDVIGEDVAYNQRLGLGPASVNVEVVRIDDAGQSILMASFASIQPCSYRLTRRSGASIHFTARMSDWSSGGFSRSSIADNKCTLQIDSNVIETELQSGVSLGSPTIDGGEVVYDGSDVIYDGGSP